MAKNDEICILQNNKLLERDFSMDFKNLKHTK